jgi:FKBP-type peptidyl-prolyl cis-trans isomerase FklB
MTHTSRAALFALIFPAAVAAQETVELETPAQRFSYTVGLQVGDNLGNQGLINLDTDALAQGIQDQLAGRDPRLTPEEMQEAVVAYQQVLLEERIALAKRNDDAAKTFLEENKAREGVIVLESGVQYKIVTAGSGVSPAETDTVLVHYRGVTTHPFSAYS